MIQIIEKESCTGCGACLISCPRHAITMRLDDEGFEYPQIDNNICVDCGICKKKCPPLHFEQTFINKIKLNNIQKAFAARNTNIKERLISSSGSIFAVLARCILYQGGFVVGIAYDNQFNTIYKIIDNVDELPTIQGSKYLQCRADLETFKIVEKELKKGRKILFSGLACQVEGLQSFLGKDYSNLYCVDLICMGIPSAQVWQKYLNTFFYGEKIIKVNFKEKSEGWKRFNLSITTDKQIFKQYGMINPYFKSMFNTYNMRKSCFVCPFKKKERAADITIADCWGANTLVPEIDDDKGLSSVIVHTEKGMELWKLVASMINEVELPIEEIIKGNSNMVENRVCNERDRIQFYKLLNSGNCRKAFLFAERDGNLPPNIIVRLYNIIKTSIRRVL